MDFIVLCATPEMTYAPVREALQLVALIVLLSPSLKSLCPIVVACPVYSGQCPSDWQPNVYMYHRNWNTVIDLRALCFSLLLILRLTAPAKKQTFLQNNLWSAGNHKINHYVYQWILLQCRIIFTPIVVRVPLFCVKSFSFTSLQPGLSA